MAANLLIPFSGLSPSDATGAKGDPLPQRLYPQFINAVAQVDANPTDVIPARPERHQLQPRHATRAPGSRTIRRISPPTPGSRLSGQPPQRSPAMRGPSRDDKRETLQFILSQAARP